MFAVSCTTGSGLAAKVMDPVTGLYVRASTVQSSHPGQAEI
jgi:hypothetical protein